MRAKTVLVIDDTYTVRGTIKDTLFDFGCSFLEASDGAEALALLATTSPDVIILDLKLPDQSGIDVLRTARDRGWVQGKPVIVVTGYPDLESRSAAMELDVFAYITKTPLEFDELRSVVARAIGVPASDAKTIVGPQLKRRRSRTPRAPRQHGAHDARRHLLVLDDEPFWLETIAKVLESDFRLTLTTSPEAARRHVRRTHFDLVILDLRLPATNGFEVLERMRRALPDLKAIILASNPDGEDLFKSGKLALAYVPKEKLDSLPGVAHGLLTRGRPAQVFISYDHRDKVKVDHLFDKLVASGHAPWMDRRSIVGGMPWPPEIENAIARAEYFIFCATRRALLKPGVMHKELAQGLERAKEMPPGRNFFITVRLEKCDIPAPYDRFQFVNYFDRNGFDRLLQALDHNNRQPLI